MRDVLLLATSVPLLVRLLARAYRLRRLIRATRTRENNFRPTVRNRAETRSLLFDPVLGHAGRLS